LFQKSLGSLSLYAKYDPENGRKLVETVLFHIHSNRENYYPKFKKLLVLADFLKLFNVSQFSSKQKEIRAIKARRLMIEEDYTEVLYKLRDQRSLSYALNHLEFTHRYYDVKDANEIDSYVNIVRKVADKFSIHTIINGRAVFEPYVGVISKLFLNPKPVITKTNFDICLESFSKPMYNFLTYPTIIKEIELELNTIYKTQKDWSISFNHHLEKEGFQKFGKAIARRVVLKYFKDYKGGDNIALPVGTIFGVLMNLNDADWENIKHKHLGFIDLILNSLKTASHSKLFMGPLRVTEGSREISQQEWLTEIYCLFYELGLYASYLLPGDLYAIFRLKLSELTEDWKKRSGFTTVTAPVKVFIR
jgi:hypothetical protein